MDTKIDPQLAMLAEFAGREDDDLKDLAETGFFGIETAAARRPGRRAEQAVREVQVLVQSAGDPEALTAAGLSIRSQIGDVYTGTIAIDRLAELAAADGVERIESAREMVAELDLAATETRVNLVHQGPPGRRGAGVIVGIVDTGVDYTHPSFRRSDGTSRILFIWDQSLSRQGAETAPSFGYGVEYTNAQINAALATANPFATVRHRDAGGHGTHVAGIAAGDGSAAGSGQPAFTFVGAAPEADLIVVRVAGGGAEGLGTSANALDAVNYCFQRAQSVGQPCVVNMSLGDNLGPHDGTSLLERGLDNLLGPQGRAFVKSAGNVGSARHHAGGTVGHGTTVDVGFLEPAGNTTPDQLDFWYRGGDTFRAAVVDAAGNATNFVNVGSATTVTLPGGNTVRIDHRNNDPFNGDKRIFITIQRGTAAQILPGNWNVRLHSLSSPTGGRFDGWIQRHNVFNQRPTFTAPFESNDRTISTPGTARKVITAANYITRGAGVGSLASSSSRGPTRDGRAAPTIAAPGTNVISARAEPGSGDPYVAMSGTSMSAPHLAGVIALMLQKNSSRTQEQLRACLTSTARRDGFTGPVPNTAWGAGKMDAQAAVNCVPSPGGPGPISVVASRCPSLTLPCQSVPSNRCPPTVVVATCPSAVVRTCPPSAVTRCPSVAVPCASITIQCPPSMLTICPQPSVPAITCGRGPSVVDACPSTPAGCLPGGPLVFDPGVNLLAAALAALNPALFAPGAQAAAPTGTFSGLPGQEEDAQAAAVGAGPPPLPPEGYYEYDESWFDDSGAEEPDPAGD